MTIIKIPKSINHLEAEFSMKLLKVFPNLNDRYATIKNLKPLEIRQIKKNINRLKPIMPLVIVKTLNGRGVNPARNNVASQI